MIKQIENIPMTVSDKRRSARESLRADIAEAIKNRIPKFEFEGDYNYKYLNQYAREESDNVFRKMYFYEAKEVREKAKEELGNDYVQINPWEYSGRYFKATSHKGEDRIHVYGELFFDFLDNFSEIYYNDLVKKSKEYAERRKLREEDRKRREGKV